MMLNPFLPHVLRYSTIFSLLCGGHLAAVQIRLRIPWGLPLGPGYDALPPQSFLVLALAAALGYLVGSLGLRRQQFVGFLLALGLAVVGSLWVLPDLSQLQLIYFGVASLALGIFILLWANRITKLDQAGFFAQLGKAWAGRHLLGLWLGYNIQARYTQTILGILWIVLLPLSTSIVLAVAFSEILQVRYDVPYISFFLAALIPFGLFNQSLLNSTNALIGKMGLLLQVPLPRAVLVLLVLGEALVDFAFTFAAMLLVNLVNGLPPSEAFIYLPLLLLILIAFSLGAMFFLSCLSLLIRDIPQLVAVLLQLLFYLTPILYGVKNIPDRLQVLVLLNPLASLMQAFRDVLVYRRPPDIITLYYPTVLAIAFLYAGYAFFLANEKRLADFA
jgi:lipopolysaccharide transport system permease protein